MWKSNTRRLTYTQRARCGRVPRSGRPSGTCGSGRRTSRRQRRRWRPVTELPYCQGPDWHPRASTKTDGTCGACGTPLTGRNHWFCRSPAHDDASCRLRYLRNHHWGDARRAARRRDGEQCRRCGSTQNLEVNHMTPRNGRGYQPGCHNHQDNLETLCRPHHVETTTAQRRARKEAV